MADGFEQKAQISREHSETKRDKQYPLRMNTEEREKLDAAALLHGMKLSRYLVEAGLAMGRGSGLAEQRQSIDELMRIRVLLGRSASNINQIARHANATDEFPDDAAAAVRYAKDLMIRIDALVRGML
ncbi:MULTISPECIES: MobC family plasmid mobilization relaxosome protein [Paenarthrobacter]|uniref:MobC family plasmid mobilization relaxosome protein n=1 Tax=Paenarthrobacter ureafaciens TaxID=37931 RepID=A0AAX3EQG2_PAEUR|nr:MULTISPECIES: MobC family plasmid mobilization relaxosome protein [Paenarthrobacter]MDO5867118.1 MobC family plasmid mobilization relaxosome protein [Paenarthrobacter sp. SD-2]MDO5878372.1 MobC family plasmid mobilization relaxosome protein [Paenarthrobacter sp. SD-1]UYV95599.1 MobC family plasmid mobilization relaxosome protein [Paenarthrobacter ureafaciens]UYW00242.1 MobC family plasmid mobilization relaxosome protein [Paenarthrobacter ureafaciens]